MQQTVTSKDNPSIKLFQKLSSNKKYRSEYRMFTLEGLRLIKDAVNENAPLHCIFITEGCMEKADFLPKNVQTMIISDELGKRLAMTEGTQGIFAICRMPENPNISSVIKSSGKYIVLHNLQDPGNMGTIIRTADAMGVDGVIAINCCDIYNPKTIRSTMGSLFRTKLCICGEEEAFTELTSKGITSYASVIDSDAQSLADISFEEGAAVFIGNEGNGLPSETADRCSKKLTIKMNGNVNSLNAATAASIIMWELTK